MIRIAFTTLPKMGNTKIRSAFFPSVSLEIGHDILNSFFVYREMDFAHSYKECKYVEKCDIVHIFSIQINYVTILKS